MKIPIFFSLVLGERTVLAIQNNLGNIDWKLELKKEKSLYNTFGYFLDTVFNKQNQINPKHLKEIKDHINYLKKEFIYEKEADYFEEWIKQNTTIQ